MSRFNVGELADAVGVRVEPRHRGTGLSSVSTDTRTLEPGAVFFAIRGERLDGCSFLQVAFERGAAAAVVPESAPDLGPGRLVLRVPDVRSALADFARWYREDAAFRVVAITGSAGKTTTKELLFHMLSGTIGEVMRAPKSFNNDIGLPLTLLSADRDIRVVVLELGTSNPGEIDALGAIAQPDVAIITNIGEAHLEGLGSVEGVAREKLSLLKHVRSGGAVVLGGDDLRLRGAASAYATVRGRHAVTICGFGEGNDWRAHVLERGASWTAATTYGSCPGPELRMSAPGRHMIMDALLALAAAQRLGVDPREAAASLEAFTPLPGRQNLVRAAGIMLVDDTYNANPTSVCASLEAFASLVPPADRTVVLGPMAELGPTSPERHEAIGRFVAMLGVGRLVTVGASDVARGARAAGLPAEQILELCSPFEVAQAVGATLRPGQAVLFKASRACRLELAFEATRDHLTAARQIAA